MRGVLVVPLVMLALAGCVAPNPSVDSGIVEPLPLEEVHVITDGTDCKVLAVLVIIDVPHAYTFLPPGYTPADVGSLVAADTPSGPVGPDVPTGEAAMAVTTVQCADSEVGAYMLNVPIILIEPPAIDVEIRDDGLHGYAPYWFTDSPAIRDAFEATRLPHAQLHGTLNVLVEGSALHEGLRTVSRLDDLWTEDGDPVWAGASTGTAPYDFTGEGFLLWTDHAEGTTVFETKLAVPIDHQITFSIGEAECSAGQDSYHARMADTTSCTQGEAFGFNILDFNADDSAFHFFPGVHA